MQLFSQKLNSIVVMVNGDSVQFTLLNCTLRPSGELCYNIRGR